MTPADIVWEYRQIASFEYERATGKPYSEDKFVHDSSFDDWLKEQGINYARES